MTKIKMPAGLTKKDSFRDAIERADYLATPGHHSGMMCLSKDLRRIVLLVYGVRRLREKIVQLEAELMEKA